MALKRVTVPANDPVTLEQAKAHLREDSSDFDETIRAFISAATEYVDGPGGYLGRALIDQTWDYYIDRFPCADYRIGAAAYIEIPLPPLIEVVGIFYLDANGDEQTVNSSSYRVDPASELGRVIPINGVTWPIAMDASGAVRVRFRAGYIDPSNSPPTDNVPATICAAILLYVGDLYQNRENTVVGDTAQELPFAATMLLKRHRIYLSMT